LAHGHQNNLQKYLTLGILRKKFYFMKKNFLILRFQGLNTGEGFLFNHKISNFGLKDNIGFMKENFIIRKVGSGLVRNYHHSYAAILIFSILKTSSNALANSLTILPVCNGEAVILSLSVPLGTVG